MGAAVDFGFAHWFSFFRGKGKSKKQTRQEGKKSKKTNSNKFIFFIVN
jgi:hypothetical protein